MPSCKPRLRILPVIIAHAAASRRDRTSGLANFSCCSQHYRPLRNIQGSRVACVRQTYNSIRILGIAWKTEGKPFELLRRLRLAAAWHGRHVLELRNAETRCSRRDRARA